MEDLMMQNRELKEKFDVALCSVVEKFKQDKKCLAAFLVGSMSHDLIWEYSDLEILAIYDDSYKGPSNFNLLEHDVQVVVNIRKRNTFKDYLGSADVSDYWFCALSKSTLLFSKELTLKEFFEDIFYIGERDMEIEMLLGFSEAVYYLNKAEKNFRVKRDSPNAIYFLFHLARGIAWLEVARNRLFPEREIIQQASELNPNLFSRIYAPLFYELVTDKIIDEILRTCHKYLEDNTMVVYQRFISYLKEHGTLKDFSMETRKHGFGINYNWLYRMNLVERYVEPIKINNQTTEFYQFGYRLKDNDGM